MVAPSHSDHFRNVLNENSCSKQIAPFEHLYHQALCSRQQHSLGGRHVSPSLSLQLHPRSLPSELAMLLEMMRGQETIWLEERRRCRCQNTACDLLAAFSCISHFPLRGSRQRETRSRLVFVLRSHTQREIFIRSSSEIERLRRGERWLDREEMELACLLVSVYLPAHSSVTKHDERTSVCWQIIAILWSSRDNIRAWSIWAGWVH